MGKHTAWSAIPENLYRYSDVCTSSAKQLQSWVLSALKPAIAEYQAGGGTCEVIDADAVAQFGAVLRLDQYARSVGQAFQQAGAATARPGRKQQYIATDQAVDTALRRIQHQAQLDAGAALGRRFKDAKTFKDQKALLGILDQRAGDPYFSAGFFNTLEDWQLETVIALGGSRALVSACSTDVLDKKVLGFVAHQLTRPAPTARFPVSLTYHSMTNGQKLELLKALAASPAAAANFARYLTDDGKALKALLGGTAYPHPSGRPSALQIAAQRAYLSMLRSAVTKMTPGQVQKLVINTGKNFPMVTAGDLDAVMPDLKEFMRASSAAMIPPIPTQRELGTKAGANLLNQWAVDFGKRAHSFDDFYLGISTIYTKAGEDSAKARDIVIDAAFAASFAFPPEGLMALGMRGAIFGKEVGGEVVSGFTEDRVKDVTKPWIIGILKKNHKDDDPGEAAQYANLYAGLYLISRMAYNSKGMVTDKSGWPDLNAPDGMAQLFSHLRDGGSQDWPATSTWAMNQKINGGKTQYLGQLLDAYIAVARTKPTNITLPDPLPPNSIWRHPGQ